MGKDTLIEDIYPLSPLQQGMLFHSLYAGRKEVYVEQLSFTISGQFDALAFKQAWQQLIERHPVLRTTFLWERREEPLQAVFRHGKMSWQEYDWREFSGIEQEQKLEALMRSERAAGFDLSQLPLIRFFLIRLTKNTNQFLWNYHHLLLDGWSVSLLLKELFESYDAFRSGGRQKMVRPRPFGDYITWLKNQDPKDAENFWRERLKGFDSPVLLDAYPPAAKLSAGEESYKQRSVSLDSETTSALQSLMRQNGLTMNTLVQGVMALILNLYSGQADVVFGVTVSGRPAELSGVGEMIGLFINTIPARIQVQMEEKVLTWLRSVQAQQVEAQPYQYSPLVEIQGWSELPRGTQLFDSLLVFENYPATNAARRPEGALRIQNVRVNDWSDYGLTLAAWIAPQLTLRLAFDQNKFDDQAITHLLNHSLEILKAIARDSDQFIGALNPLTGQERRQQLVEWNGLRTNYPREGHLAKVFEDQSLARPDAVAVASGQQQISYGELNRRANQVANFLRRMGVGLETRVGVCLNRSLELIIGLLGVVKAGGVYVPLDASYPIERLWWMVEDADINLVLSTSEEIERLPAQIGQVVCLDSQRGEIEQELDESWPSGAVGDNVVYLSYTSGSTGQPKAVEVCHRGILRLMCDQEYVRFDENQRLLHLSPLSFDASSFEIWGALLKGGCCVIYPAAQPTVRELGQVIGEHRVTTMWLTASLFNLIIDEGWEGLRGVKQLIAGGEPLSAKHLRRARSLLPELELSNGYGPTESATFTTTWQAGEMSDAETVPLGRPINNTQVYVLDKWMRELPVGVVGELSIGGEGLARGYLKRPELTAERFVPDPYAEDRGGRLYRTGDLMRYSREGHLMFVGRTDLQVKVRGFRIELEEIETALKQHPSLRAVAVAVREDDGNKRLVAYATTTGDESPRWEELQNYLRGRVPEYLVPGSYVILNELPLKANGKVDRRKLSDLELGRDDESRKYEAPRTKTEQILAEVWSAVLGLSTVGIRDNYFELGGDSIRSIQILAKAQRRGLNFSLQSLFQYPTIFELAQVLEEGHQKVSTSFSIPPFGMISSTDREQLPGEVIDSYPLTRLQAGMVFHSELNPETTVYHDIFSLHLRAPFDGGALYAALQDLIARHEVLRTSFDLGSFSEPLQLVHRNATARWKIHEIGHFDAMEQERILAAAFEAEKERAFDWRQAPLWRVEIFRRSEETFQLIFSLHHAILDGWSFATLLTEWFKHYWHLLGKPADALAPPPQASFREFVFLERQAHEAAETRQFWREQVENCQFTKLPRIDSADTSKDEKRASENVKILSAELATQASCLAARLGVPLKNVLLAVHLRMLSWLCSQDDVTTGLVMHGRPEGGDGDRVLGLFLNTLPFRLYLGGGTWAELARQTFDLEQKIFPHRRYPLADIQQISDGQALFETAFGFLHFHVYQAFGKLGKAIEVLDGRALTETNFAFVATFSLDPLSSQMRLALMADPKQLNADWVDRISEYYLRTLEAMVNNPDGNYQHHNPLSDAERQQLVAEWNSTGRDYPRHLGIHELFARQARQRPDAIALAWGAEQINYRVLNYRAGQLANRLMELGAGRGTVVGLCVSRSVELIIGMLGILKAGGIYLPLDISYPAERLALMVEDAGAQVLVVDGENASLLPSEGRAVINLTRDWESSIAHLSGINKCGRFSGYEAAYINYTSGSTGQPKGILIPHRAVNRLVCQTNYIDLRPSDCVAQGSNASFDAATFEIWGALLNGARLVGLSGDELLAPEIYARRIWEEQVTVLFLTTALFNQLAREAPWAFAGVTHVLFGGQASEPRWVAAVMAQGIGGRLLHVYGPTESTTYATWHEVREYEGRAATIPIGQPLANTEVYVLGGELEPVPLGVTGEIWIGGDGLAHGYFGQSSLTAERFVPDPFSGRRGARLYRTGDLGRRVTGGDIEFIGRVDHQVKIRGYRVELDEIAVILGSYEGVEGAAVAIRNGENGEQQLVAYLEAKDRELIKSSELRDYLRGKLPEYMVPGTYILMDKLPLTPNGKIDRRGLPEPEEEEVMISGFVEPRNAEEEILAGIFGQVLNTRQIGISDSFFDLGGHSLLATQVISRVREIFSIELPLRKLFENPTIAGLTASIEVARRSEHSRILPPITPGDHQERIPLSFAQQRLWFLNQFEPQSPSYHIPAILRMDGDLQIGALEQSLSEIRRRHEILRSIFPRPDGQPFQAVSPPQPLDSRLIDLSLVLGEEVEEAIERLASEEVVRPFDLTEGPLLRVTLIRLGSRQHIMLLTQHHIISDGWSIGIFFKELAALYHHFSDGAPSPLSELAIQYRDFARWQREILAGPELDQQLSYWMRQLAGATSVLQLPSDRPRPAGASYQGATEPFALSERLSHTLQRFSEREGVTVFMTVLAVFGSLLHRYSGQGDVLIGAPIANRHRGETEDLIGFFVNTLALRLRFHGGEISFRSLLSQVRQTCLDAYAHQDLPFEKLVDELGLERGLSYNPLVQVVLAFQNVPLQRLELSGLALNPAAVTNRTSLFDLTLSLSTSERGLSGYLQYSTSLFDAVTIRRLKCHLTRALENLLENPNERLSALSMMTEWEQHQLIIEWNRAEDSGAPVRLDELFERQARCRPDAIALVSDEGGLSYAALNMKADRLAGRLQRTGVEPGDIVGLGVERSLDLVIGLLAILKAGGAYLPLDPGYPAERQKYLIDDTGTSVVVTHSQLKGIYPHEVETVYLDQEQTCSDEQSGAVSDCRVTGNSVAYVIHTSGSTGHPKGVMVTHHQVARLMKVTEDRYQFKPSDVWTLFHSYAFDFSVWEMWGALLYGGRLVIVPYWISRAPELFHELLVREGITILNQTPSAFRQLLHVDEADQEARPSLALRQVIFGGEALEPAFLKSWFERHGDSQPKLVNMYGITETTVHVTYRALSREDANGNGGSKIGGPIDDLQLYILDQYAEPAPLGVPGQICVGGAGVADGYLNRPASTAERFTPDPWSRQPGARMYQSGDLGRYLANGDIEYLGRMDHQVKIRGFRIEIGEVEAVLAQYPMVREVVVMMQSKRAGGPQLVAWVVPQPGSEIDLTHLRHHAQLRLPDYMIPAALLIIESLPLTTNGKVDRQSLSLLSLRQSLPENAFDPPKTAIEARLAEIWSGVLGVENVGRHDNFFELGGDSILSILVINKINQLGLKLTPKQLFQSPTISQLALMCQAVEVIEESPRSGAGPVPLTPIQRWFFEQELLDPHHWNQALMLQFRPPLDLAKLQQAIRKIEQLHDALRLRFHREPSGWRQICVEPGGDDAYLRIDLANVAEDKLKSTIEDVANSLQASLCLSEGPLWRVALFDCGPDRFGRLLIIIHHLLVDGVSWRILLEDLQTAYLQISRGDNFALPPIMTSYQQWARSLVNYANSAEAHKDLAYWLQAVKEPCALLPVDYADGCNTVASAKVIAVSFTPEETKRLLTEIPAVAHGQINEVLLTALGQVLTAWAGAPVTIDLEGHGREEIGEGLDILRTVGWFTTIFPVRLNVYPAQTPGDALREVKDQLRRVPRQGLSYGVWRYLPHDDVIATGLDAPPRSQLAFNYLGQFDQTINQSSLFQLSSDGLGPLQSARDRRYYQLEITSSIIGGQLRLAFIYSRNLHRKATIENLVKLYADRLRKLMAQLQKPEVANFAPSDFPRAQVSQEELQKLISKLDQRRSGGLR